MNSENTLSHSPAAGLAAGYLGSPLRAPTASGEPSSCVNYRKINEDTVQDSSSPFSTDDILHFLALIHLLSASPGAPDILLSLKNLKQELPLFSTTTCWHTQAPGTEPPGLGLGLTTGSGGEQLWHTAGLLNVSCQSASPMPSQTSFAQRLGGSGSKSGPKPGADVPLASFLQLHAALAELSPPAVTQEHCCCSHCPATANTSLLAASAARGFARATRTARRLPMLIKSLWSTDSLCPMARGHIEWAPGHHGASGRRGRALLVLQPVGHETSALTQDLGDILLPEECQESGQVYDCMRAAQSQPGICAQPRDEWSETVQGDVKS